LSYYHLSEYSEVLLPIEANASYFEVFQLAPSYYSSSLFAALSVEAATGFQYVKSLTVADWISKSTLRGRLPVCSLESFFALSPLRY